MEGCWGFQEVGRTVEGSEFYSKVVGVCEWAVRGIFGKVCDASGIIYFVKW
nr:hypothetical protein [Candidatus Freyarchaeota archaeon]